MDLQLGNNKNTTTYFLVCEESMTELKRIDVFVTDRDTHLLFTLLVNERAALSNYMQLFIVSIIFFYKMPENIL